MPWIPYTRLTPPQLRAVRSAYPDHDASWYLHRAFLFSRRGYLRTDDGALQVVVPAIDGKSAACGKDDVQ